jgi:hypothetical protein
MLMFTYSNTQVAKLASRGLLQHDTNSGAQYDVEKNSVVKLGKALRINDIYKALKMPLEKT